MPYTRPSCHEFSCDYSFFFSSRRRHTRCALVTGVQTCALPISKAVGGVAPTYDPAPASAARRGINRRLLLLRRILHRTLNRLRPVDRCLDRIAQLCIGLRFGRLVRGRRRWPVARGASQRQQQRTRNHRRRSERPRHGGILDWPRRYATPNPKRKAAMDPHRWRLDGQLALVTGGSAGIGLATARALLGFGARVLITARNGDSLERARDELAEE